MPARKFERIALAQLLLSGCACLRPDRTCASTAGLRASSYAAAAARFKSVQSQYGASTALPADHAFNTKHNTFNTNHRSKW